MEGKNVNQGKNVNPGKSSNNVDGKIEIKKIRNGIGIFILLMAVLLTLYYIYGLVNRIFFNFKKFGGDFDKSRLYKLHFSRDDYGLKREDYIDFDINIRTDEGLSDCKINGRMREEGLEYVDVKGPSDICQSLKY
jgi:hypothetical protein